MRAESAAYVVPLPMLWLATAAATWTSKDRVERETERQNRGAPEGASSYVVPIKPLVKFDALPYSWFSKLQFLPLPYTGGTGRSLGKTWVFGVSCCNSTDGFFSEEKIKAASKHYAPFLTDELECSGCTSTASNMRVEVRFATRWVCV